MKLRSLIVVLLSLAGCDSAPREAPELLSLVAIPPTVPRGAQTTLVASATDPFGASLIYQWALPAGWSFADPTHSGRADVSITAPDQPGQTAVIQLTVDNGRDTASGTVTVATPQDNGPVIASISAIPPVVTRGGTIELAVSATDPEGLPLTYAWSAPSGWTLTPSASGATATLVAPSTSAQHASIDLTVTDSANASIRGSILVGTADNLPPTVAALSADTTHPLPNGVAHLTASAADPDGDTLGYAWTSSDPHWSVSGTGAMVTVTAPPQNGVTAALTVTVSDGHGGTTAATIVLSTGACGAGLLDCDRSPANGCETDVTTATNCGGCGVACDVGEVCDHGSVCRAPSLSCEDILQSGRSLGDGNYTILPPGAAAPYAVYCDMTSDGGGWTAFYAGLNGNASSFDHFELTDRDCADPQNRCLQRLPSTEVQGEILATCGADKLAFRISDGDARDYLVNGGRHGWRPLDQARAVDGLPNPGFATSIYTGYPYNTYLDDGFIIGDSSPMGTFLDNGYSRSYSSNANAYSYCNGVYDVSSPARLYYRSRTATLQIVAPINQVIGVPFDVTVSAFDSVGGVAQFYTGTIHLGASNADVTLPADYTFTSGDAGVHVLSVTLNGTGPRTIMATDSVHATLSAAAHVQTADLGSSSNPATSCLAILTGGAAGGDGPYWLTDGVTAYLNVCDMTTDGGGWTAFYLDGNGGPNVFDLFENTSFDCPSPLSRCMRRVPTIGAPEVLASCGAAKAAFFMPASLARYFELGLEAPGWVSTVGVRAISGAPALAGLAYVYAGGNGNGFIVGDRVTPANSFGSAFTGGGWDYCNGQADTRSPLAFYYRSRVDHFVLSAAVDQATGTPFDVTLRAVGKYGDVIADHLGTVHFSSTDGGAVLPADYTFVPGDAGVHTFTGGVTLAAAIGSVTLTATDTVIAMATGSSVVRIDTVGIVASPAASCRAVLTGGATQSGIYWLTDGVAPYSAYCDLTTAGGGWTLVLKTNGRLPTFAWDAAEWTNSATVNPSQADFDTSEAKLQSWNAVSFTEMLVEMTSQNGDSLHAMQMPVAASSMFALMSPGTFVPTTLGRAAWEGLVGSSSLQQNCNEEGFNITGTNGFAVRIGIVSNQENDCGSNDSRIGLGGTGASCYGDATVSTGNISGCDGDNGDVSIAAFGWVLVR